MEAMVHTKTLTMLAERSLIVDNRVSFFWIHSQAYIWYLHLFRNRSQNIEFIFPEMETNQKCFLYDPTILSDAMNKISYKLKGLWKILTNLDFIFSIFFIDNFIIRPLELCDHKNGYLKLLSQLTDVGQMDKKHFESMFWKILYAICLRLICNIIEIFNHMKSSKSYYITVIEDVNSSLIVGTATLFTENKFIHGGSLVSICYNFHHSLSDLISICHLNNVARANRRCGCRCRISRSETRWNSYSNEKIFGWDSSML